MFARHTEKCGAVISPDIDGCDSSKLMGFCAKANTHISTCTMLDMFGFSSPKESQADRFVIKIYIKLCFIPLSGSFFTLIS